MFAQLRGIDPPHLAEDRIEELHSAVAAENHDPFLEGVQRLSLYVREGAHLRGKRIALRRIIVKIGDPALRIGTGDDAECSPVRKMPNRLVRLDRLIRAQLLSLPFAKVHLLRQLSIGAHALEDFAIGGMLGEERRFLKGPHLSVGRVVEGQPLDLSKIATAVESRSIMREYSSSLRSISARNMAISDTSCAIPAEPEACGSPRPQRFGVVHRRRDRPALPDSGVVDGLSRLAAQGRSRSSPRLSTANLSSGASRERT